MLKLGITRLNQLLRRTAEDNRLIAASLLLDVEHAPVDLETKRSIRTTIIRSMILPNTTGKTTWKNRFVNIDAIISTILKQHFPQSLRCLDVGASDCSTAVDLFAYLQDIPGICYVATDLNECLYIRKRRPWVDVCDDEGRLIQVSCGPFVIPITSLVHMHPLQIINRMLYFWNYVFRRPKVKVTWQNRNSDDAVPFIKLSMLSAEFQELTKTDKRIQFQRMNVFSPPKEKYDFIRIMNVLNVRRDNFGFIESDIGRACRAMLPLLSDNGFLLIGRTSPVGKAFETNATVFQRKGGRLEVFFVFGKGTEIDNMVEKAWAQL